MAKRTKKAGITGKYGARFGGSLRKISRKYEVAQHMRYTCSFCGKNTLKRKSVGIWTCSACYKTISGGAWTPSTNNALAANQTLIRMKKLEKEES